MRHRYFLLCLLISAFLSDSARAETLLITNGNVLIGDSPASQLDILVENGRIETVAKDLTSIEADRVPMPPGALSPRHYSPVLPRRDWGIGMVYEAVDSRLNGLYTGLSIPNLTCAGPTTPTPRWCLSRGSRVATAY